MFGFRVGVAVASGPCAAGRIPRRLRSRTLVGQSNPRIPGAGNFGQLHASVSTPLPPLRSKPPEAGREGSLSDHERPPASSPEALARMKRQKRRDTKPELVVRKKRGPSARGLSRRGE